MATWLAHLRVADILLDKFSLPEREFLAGNIAPDCGVPVSGGFDPPKEITHWTSSGKGHCDFERFYREMLSEKLYDSDTRAFLLGYFCHLMADVLWVRLINEPCKEKHWALYSADREEYYRRVKPEWYANDHLYLRRHPDNRAFGIFCGIREFPVNCIPYYKPDNVEKQIHYIQRFYLNPPEYSEQFAYLTPQTADSWVRTAAQIIAERLSEMDIQ